ncbi:MAG: hypothetical protein E5V92_00095 [Mesorhizobium sp.]|nr:MAG: hypothetical protein E5V92_00095 [Mesorhizobium sp.]
MKTKMTHAMRMELANAVGWLCGRSEQGQTPDLGGVHRGDRLSRKIRDPCPERLVATEASADSSTASDL